MAVSIIQSENADIDCINEVLADHVIDILRELNGEYDSLVKSAEKRIKSDGTRFEMNICKSAEREYFVHDVVEQGISTCDEMKRRWDEQELSNKLLDIQEMVRVFQKEKQASVEKSSLLERRLIIETNKINSLDEKIKYSLEIGNDLHNKEQQLKSVTNKLESLSVGESIYPTAMLELHTACNQLQARLENMEKELLKYADLPPDYKKAREKLTEVMLMDTDLEKRIRNVLKQYC